MACPAVPAGVPRAEAERREGRRSRPEPRRPSRPSRTATAMPREVAAVRCQSGDHGAVAGDRDRCTGPRRSSVTGAPRPPRRAGLGGRDQPAPRIPRRGSGGADRGGLAGRSHRDHGGRRARAGRRPTMCAGSRRRDRASRGGPAIRRPRPRPGIGPAPARERERRRGDRGRRRAHEGAIPLRGACRGRADHVGADRRRRRRPAGAMRRAPSRRRRRRRADRPGRPSSWGPDMTHADPTRLAPAARVPRERAKAAPKPFWPAGEGVGRRRSAAR